MKVLKKLQKFIDKDGKEVKYYQLYIELCEGYKMPIKCIKPDDAIVLKRFAEIIESEVK